MVHCWLNRLCWSFQAKLYHAWLRNSSLLILFQPTNINDLPPSNTRHCSCIPQVYRIHLSFCKIAFELSPELAYWNSCLGDGVHGAARHLYVQFYFVENMLHCSRWRNLTNSTHGLGHYLGLLWQTTDYGSMSTCSIPFMHRTCAGTNIRLLVVDGSPVLTGRWVSQYSCNR